MRAKCLVSILFMLALVASSPALHAKERWPCDNPTTYDQVQCLGRALKQAQKMLEAKYTAVREEFDVLDLTDPASAEREAANLLLADLTQKSWRIYVDQTCELVGRMWLKGTGRLPAELRCELELTEQRTRDLDRLFYKFMAGE